MCLSSLTSSKPHINIATFSVCHIYITYCVLNLWSTCNLQCFFSTPALHTCTPPPKHEVQRNPLNFFSKSRFSKWLFSQLCHWGASATVWPPSVLKAACSMQLSTQLLRTDSTLCQVVHKIKQDSIDLCVSPWETTPMVWLHTGRQTTIFWALLLSFPPALWSSLPASISPNSLWGR